MAMAIHKDNSNLKYICTKVVIHNDNFNNIPLSDAMTMYDPG